MGKQSVKIEDFLLILLCFFKDFYCALEDYWLFLHLNGERRDCVYGVTLNIQFYLGSIYVSNQTIFMVFWLNMDWRNFFCRGCKIRERNLHFIKRKIPSCKKISKFLEFLLQNKLKKKAKLKYWPISLESFFPSFFPLLLRQVVEVLKNLNSSGFVF